MAWKPYQDQQNRAYSSILTTLFPEQTKTLPRLLVWSVIFLLDLTVLAAAAFSLQIFPTHGGMFSGLLFIGILVGLFWLQGAVWGWITGFFKKRKENRNVSL